MKNITSSAELLFELMTLGERSSCLRRLNAVYGTDGRSRPAGSRSAKSPNVFEVWLRDRLHQGWLLDDRPGFGEMVPTESVRGQLVADNPQIEVIDKRGIETGLGRAMNKIFNGLHNTKKVVEEDGETRRKPFYIIPPLAECRKSWEAAFGPEDWPS